MKIYTTFQMYVPWQNYLYKHSNTKFEIQQDHGKIEQSPKKIKISKLISLNVAEKVILQHTKNL